MTGLLKRIAWVLGVLTITGCTSWRPGSFRDGPVPDALRVTLRDRSTVQVEDARLVGDSLLVGRGFYSDSFSIPIRDVTAVQTRRFDLPKTLTLVGVSVGIGIPVLAAVVWFVGNLCTGPCT